MINKKFAFLILVVIFFVGFSSLLIAQENNFYDIVFPHHQTVPLPQVHQVVHLLHQAIQKNLQALTGTYRFFSASMYMAGN